MREPVFNETVQLGIVVRDLEATVRRYVDDYRIGPWEFAQSRTDRAELYPLDLPFGGCPSTRPAIPSKAP